MSKSVRAFNDGGESRLCQFRLFAFCDFFHGQKNHRLRKDLDHAMRIVKMQPIAPVKNIT